MGSMRAAVLEEGGKLVVGQVDIDDPRPGEVLVDVSDCGMCHSDLSVVDGAIPAPLPVVLGHEISGHRWRTRSRIFGAPQLGYSRLSRTIRVSTAGGS